MLSRVVYIHITHVAYLVACVVTLHSVAIIRLTCARICALY